MKVYRIRLPLADPDRFATLVLVGLGIFALVQLLMPLFSGLGLERTLVRDDAFYQFAVARNLAAGAGFTIDGQHAAGGVQFLWTVLLAGVCFVLGSDSLPLVAVVLGVGFHLATGYILYRIALIHAQRVFALGIAAFCLSRPLLLTEAMNGQETALALFLLSAWTLRVLRPTETAGAKDRIGLLLALLLPWARTEYVIFPFAFFVMGVAAPLWGGQKEKGLRFLPSTLISLGVYLVLQWLFFGQPWPVSGQAVPWLFHDAFYVNDPSTRDVLARYWWFARPVLLAQPYGYVAGVFAVLMSWWILAPLSWIRRTVPIFLTVLAFVFGAADLWAVAIASGLLFIGGSFARQLYKSSVGVSVCALCMGFVAIVVLHYPLRWYPREYYLVSSVLPGLVLASLFAGKISSQGLPLALIPIEKRIRSFWIFLLVVSFVDLPRRVDRFAWQAETCFAAQSLEYVLDKDDGVCAFNSGCLSWYWRGPTRNLDGAVDGAMFTALKEKRLLAWMQEQGMSFLLDQPRQIALEDPDTLGAHASGRYLGGLGPSGLTPVVAFDIPKLGGKLPDTDCLILYALPDTPALDLGNKPELLARVDGGVVLLLPRPMREDKSRPILKLESDGKEQFFNFDPSAWQAPWIVTLLAYAKGSLEADGKLLIEW